MASNTQNYNLKQWESSDKPTMEDFNDTNRKVDAALTSLLEGKAASSHAHATASTGVAGFLSATDKVKLDNVPADTISDLANKVNLQICNFLAKILVE